MFGQTRSGGNKAGVKRRNEAAAGGFDAYTPAGTSVLPEAGVEERGGYTPSDTFVSTG